MVRSVLGVIAGVLAGVVAVILTEAIGHSLFPPPPGLDFKDREALVAAMDKIPVGAKIAVIVAWFLGVFAGAATTSLIGRRWAPLAWLVAAILFAFACQTMLMIPHPLWMWVASVVAAIAGAYLAVKLTDASWTRPIAKAPTPKM
jgi:hypothetical protein